MKNLSLCVVVLLTAISALAESVETVVVSVRGKVEYALPSSNDFAPLAPSARLPVGARIRTGADGVSYITPFPGAGIKIEENTLVTLTEVDLSRKDEVNTKRKAILEVSQGSIIPSLDSKLASRTNFRIRTPVADFISKGTAYQAFRNVDGSWTVIVGSGSVEINLADGSKKIVGAKKKVTIFRDGTISVVEDATPEDLARIQGATEASIALRLITGPSGGLERADTDSGISSSSDLIIINPANISGENSPSGD